MEVDGKEKLMTFLTNQLTWSPQSVADLYRCRWRIEVFFKQIKQTLQLSDSWGPAPTPYAGKSGRPCWSISCSDSSFSVKLETQLQSAICRDTNGTMEKVGSDKSLRTIWDSQEQPPLPCASRAGLFPWIRVIPWDSHRAKRIANLSGGTDDLKSLKPLPRHGPQIPRKTAGLPFGFALYGMTVSDFWSGTGVPLDQDLNFQLRVAAAGGTLTTVRSWLLSDGTANGINVSPGRFADPSHSVITLSGITPGSAINVEVDAWAGNYSMPTDAVNAGAGYGFGKPFTMGAGSSAAPPASLDLMPELDVRGVPEPSSWVLLSIGAFGLMLGRRRASHRLRKRNGLGSDIC